MKDLILSKSIAEFSLGNPSIKAERIYCDRATGDLILVFSSMMPFTRMRRELEYYPEFTLVADYASQKPTLTVSFSQD